MQLGHFISAVVETEIEGVSFAITDAADGKR